MDYKIITTKDLIIKIYEEILNDSQVVGELSRTAVWNKGWKENLDNYKDTNDLKSIKPKFIKDGEVKRYGSQLIMPHDVTAEEDFMDSLRTRLFSFYLNSFENIYEFGAGSGVNLLKLAQLFPDKTLYGSDFVESSIDLISLLAQRNHYNIQASLFNMISPDYAYEIQQNSAIITFGAIEQLAGKFHNFINFLISKRPELCLHIEPIYELYDIDKPVDQLGMIFHQKRGYSIGFLPMLKILESINKIKIIKIERSSFGTKYSEGFSVVIWKPI